MNKTQQFQIRIDDETRRRGEELAKKRGLKLGTLMRSLLVIEVEREGIK